MYFTLDSLAEHRPAHSPLLAFTERCARDTLGAPRVPNFPRCLELPDVYDFIVGAVACFASFEIGYWLGKRHRSRDLAVNPHAVEVGRTRSATSVDDVRPRPNEHLDR